MDSVVALTGLTRQACYFTTSGYRPSRERKPLAMPQPDTPPALASPRRAIVASIVVAAIVAAAVSLHDRAVDSRWTNALGVLLGGLAGTFIGERLAGFGERVAATRIAWLQMATIGLAIAGIISWQALPAYCQLPVSFVMGAVIVASAVYIQRLRIQLP
jgi:hypothetical protein